MVFNERISKILGVVPERISKLENLKSHGYIVENDHEKYFFKFSKESKVKKEKWGINYFNKFLGMETPEILYEGEDYLVTRFEENLQKISPSKLSSIVSCFQKRYLERPNPILMPSKFSREKISKLYEKNKRYLIGFKTKGLSKTFSKVNETQYSSLPKIISHGDIHNKNIFLTRESKTFIFDFENMSINYPTFDISTAIFYALGDAKDILKNYFSDLPLDFGLSEDKLMDLIIADTLRIALYDTLNAKKICKDRESLEKRIYNNKKFFDVFL